MNMPPVESGDICMRNVVTGENWVPMADAARIQADAARSRRCWWCGLGRWLAARRPAAEAEVSSFPGPLSKPFVEEEAPSHGDKD